MARTQTLVQLSDDLLDVLDTTAAQRGVSRSALIREALEAYLHDEREAAISRRIVDGYRRIPPGTPDEWGDLERMGDHAATALLQRLDAEERAAGHDPW